MSTGPTLLALDLGTTFGACWVDPDAGWWRVEEKTLEGDEAERYLDFERWLDRAMDDVSVLAFEDVTFNRGKSYIPGQKALIMASCVRRNVAFVGVSVPELKKWATGKGNASKEQMIGAAVEIAQKRLGELFTGKVTDNEADALLVAAWALEHAMGGPRVPA